MQCIIKMVLPSVWSVALNRFFVSSYKNFPACEFTALKKYEEISDNVFSDILTRVGRTLKISPVLEKAEVAELADALGSGSSELKLVGVRLPPSAQKSSLQLVVRSRQ